MKDDAAGVLGKVSGLGRDEVLKIWEKVRVNANTLASCAGPHQFSRLPSKAPFRFKCALCGGEVNSSDYSWYTRGLEHGARR